VIIKQFASNVTPDSNMGLTEHKAGERDGHIKRLYIILWSVDRESRYNLIRQFASSVTPDSNMGLTEHKAGERGAHIKRLYIILCSVDRASQCNLCK